MDLYQIWFRGPLADVINCAEFCGNRLRGLRLCRGSKFAINTCWRYRTACDNTTNSFCDIPSHALATVIVRHPESRISHCHCVTSRELLCDIPSHALATVIVWHPESRISHCHCVTSRELLCDILSHALATVIVWHPESRISHCHCATSRVTH